MLLQARTPFHPRCLSADVAKPKCSSSETNRPPTSPVDREELTEPPARLTGEYARCIQHARSINPDGSYPRWLPLLQRTPGPRRRPARRVSNPDLAWRELYIDQPRQKRRGPERRGVRSRTGPTTPIMDFDSIEDVSAATVRFERDPERLLLVSFASGVTVEDTWKVTTPLSDTPDRAITIRKIRAE